MVTFRPTFSGTVPSSCTVSRIKADPENVPNQGCPGKCPEFTRCVLCHHTLIFKLSPKNAIYYIKFVFEIL